MTAQVLLWELVDMMVVFAAAEGGEGCVNAYFTPVYLNGVGIPGRIYNKARFTKIDR